MMLAGCDSLPDLGIGELFPTTSKKSDLKGVRISVLAQDEDLKVDDTIKSEPVLLPPPYTNPDWPQPGGYAANVMYHLEAPGALDEVWTAEAGKGSDSDSRLTATPVTGGGRIYVLDSEAHLFAFNQRNGAKAWSRSLAPRNGVNWPTFWGLLGKHNTIEPAKGMGGGVAYDNGCIFVTSGFGVIFAMDAQLNIADGFRYTLDCLRSDDQGFCASHIGCAATGCGGGSAGGSGHHGHGGFGDGHGGHGDGGAHGCGGHGCGGSGCGGGGCGGGGGD